MVFSAADGLQIHGQLFLPPNKPLKPAPAMVFFHGGPPPDAAGWHYMYYYSNAYALNQFLANSGYVVLSVNYRSGIGYGLDFREALKYGASGGAEYNDVQGAGDYLRSRADVDAARIGAWGGSYAATSRPWPWLAIPMCSAPESIFTAYTIGPPNSASPPPSRTIAWRSKRRPWPM